MIRLLVLCGGQSPEHEVSVRSARNVVSAIDKTKFQVEIIGITLEGEWLSLEHVPDGPFIEIGSPVKLDFQKNCWVTDHAVIACDAVFPVLHGPNGEDGSIQGLLQALRVPFVSPDVLGSSTGMDKETAKNLLSYAGLNVANGFCIRAGQSFNSDLIRQLGFPVFVKPANMGSSVGVTKVNSEDDLYDSIEHAFEFDTKVLIEEMIVGRELECAVLGLMDDLQVSAPGEIRTEEEYSFDEKYSESSEAQLDIPAKNLSEELIRELKRTATIACRTLNCEILSRVDMFLTDEGKIYVNEVNTIPGFTSISMYPKLWEYEGISYTNLITELVNQAMKRHERTAGLKRNR